MAVGSGQMRHRMTIYAPTGTYGNGTAQNIDAGIPAKIEAMPLQFQQQERLAAGGLNRQTLYNVTIRYREGIQADFELHEECCTERVFQIVAIIPSDKLDWLEFTCIVGER